MNLFETKNVQKQIRCVNAVIENVYGINIKLTNSLTTTSRETLCLISKVPTIYHFNAELFKKSKLNKPLISLWEYGENKEIVANMFIKDIKKIIKATNDILHSHKWLDAFIEADKNKTVKVKCSKIDIESCIKENVIHACQCIRY